jgi:SOS response regulatory protein OraA/RecX
VRSPYAGRVIKALDHGVTSESGILKRLEAQPDEERFIRQTLRRLTESGIIQDVDHH